MIAYAPNLLERVRAAGGTLQLIGPGRLKVIAPTPLAEDLLESLRAAKPELIAALSAGNAGAPLPPSAESDEWRALYRERLAHWRAIRRDCITGHTLRYSESEAVSLAWGELECRWHRRNRKRPTPDLCAGCERQIESSAPSLTLSGGHRVHVSAGFTCVIAYGQSWRSAATAALIRLGLTPPHDDWSPDDDFGDP